MIVACDESSAKGYTNQREQRDGEVGVFAGILINADREAAIRPDFQDVYDRFVPSNGKLHIADLDPVARDKLRRVQRMVVRLYGRWHLVPSEISSDYRKSVHLTLERDRSGFAS